MIIPAAALDKLHDKLKMSEAKWRRVRTNQYFKFSNKHRRIIFFLLVFLFLLLVFLQELNKVGSAPKRCHILLSLRRQPSVNFQLSLILFSLHRMVHPAASMRTLQNTKNWMLIVEKILVLFSIVWIKFIHPFI